MNADLWTVYEGAALSSVEFFGVVLVGALLILAIEMLWPK